MGSSCPANGMDSRQYGKNISRLSEGKTPDHRYRLALVFFIDKALVINTFRRREALFDQIEFLILSTAQNLYDSWGWFGVAALLVFENATGITPSEIILALAGWMLIAEHDLSISMIFIGGLYAAIGSALGASITYWVARLGGRPVVDKIARWVRIDTSLIDRAETQFQRWGTGLTLVGRLMPGVRTLISIPAGLARMPFLTFFTATFFGAYLWCTLFIGAGYLLGHEWTLIGGYLKQALPYLLAAGALGLSGYFLLIRPNSLLVVAPVKIVDD
jgi:membrane protein DedA with SNARE-associated domain